MKAFQALFLSVLCLGLTACPFDLAHLRDVPDSEYDLLIVAKRPEAYSVLSWGGIQPRPVPADGKIHITLAGMRGYCVPVYGPFHPRPEVPFLDIFRGQRRVRRLTYLDLEALPTSSDGLRILKLR